MVRTPSLFFVLHRTTTDNRGGGVQDVPCCRHSFPSPLTSQLTFARYIFGDAIKGLLPTRFANCGCSCCHTTLLTPMSMSISTSLTKYRMDEELRM
jgi:hypothetical protein